MQQWRLARSGPAHWAVLASIACQACLPSSPEDVNAASSSVIEGKPAAVCEWPSAAVLLPSGCSGALIQRRVVATAAHCLFDASGRLEAPATVIFGETRDEPQLQVEVSTCFLNQPEDGDFAVCVLSDEAPGIPIISLMAPCESEWLKPGETAIEVGFGDTSVDSKDAQGTKSWLEVTLVRARADEPYLEVSAGSQAGEYYGDSGSPLYFRMPDGTWRLVGTDSGSPDIVTGSTAPRFSVYANAPHFLEWAERVTGIDLTPCHDENGWHPGADCVAFPVSQPNVADSWANNCSAQPTARPRPTCQDSGASGIGAGGADTSHALGGGGADSAPGGDRHDTPVQSARLEGGACSQAAGMPRPIPSLAATLALLAGLGRRIVRCRRSTNVRRAS